MKLYKEKLKSSVFKKNLRFLFKNKQLQIFRINFQINQLISPLYCIFAGGNDICCSELQYAFRDSVCGKTTRINI